MGRVAGPYGLRGWIRIEPWSEDPRTLLRHALWLLRTPGDAGAWREVEVTHCRAHGTGLVAAVAGVVTRDAAEALRGYEIALPRSTLDALGPDEHYWADLEGMTVVNRAGMVLGRVAGLTGGGAHAILRVAGDAGTERLIPFVPAYVDRVDAAGGRIEVDWQLDY